MIVIKERGFYRLHNVKNKLHNFKVFAFSLYITASIFKDFTIIFLGLYDTILLAIFC